MPEFPILSITIFLPLIGALFIMMFVAPGDNEASTTNAKNTALWTAMVNFFLSLALLAGFDSGKEGFQFVEKFEWIKGYRIYYHLGIDGISLFFVLLTTFLVPICILASFNSINKRVREYMVTFLMLESLTLGVFCALDFVLFYLFFEAVLIPMFLIIGIWGAEKRVYAAFKFFLYTLTGSVLLIAAVIYFYLNTGTTDIIEISKISPNLDLSIQKWLWLALFASFAIKVPMWPFHTWLPDVHVQAPTAGSVILAGILLKLGGYGFIRFSLPMLPDASIFFAPFIYVLSIVAVIYTSLVALVQEDMKKLIAYSSVAHMGYVTIGTFAFNQQGIEGAIIQMLSHGLVSAALFLCVGVLYDRMHTREINKYGGVVCFMPRYALFFMLFTMASIGLPATSGFIGELLVFIGIFKVSKIITIFAATGIVLGAAYMLLLYKRVMFGKATNTEIPLIKDISRRETIVFLPIAVLVMLLGIYPSYVTDILKAPVENIITRMNVASSAAMVK